MKRHSMGTVFVLLTFAVLAGSVLIVLALGADSYRQLTERGADSYEKRIGVQYIASKIRHNDIMDGVFVDGFSETYDSISTLYLSQEVEGSLYYTRIYYYEGAIRELFSIAEEEFLPEDGNEIMEAEGLEFTQQGRLLTITAVDTRGETTALKLSIRCGEEGA